MDLSWPSLVCFCFIKVFLKLPVHSQRATGTAGPTPDHTCVPLGGLGHLHTAPARPAPLQSQVKMLASSSLVSRRPFTAGAARRVQVQRSVVVAVKPTKVGRPLYRNNGVAFSSPLASSGTWPHNGAPWCLQAVDFRGLSDEEIMTKIGQLKVELASVRFLQRTRGNAEIKPGEQMQPDPENVPKAHTNKHLRRQVAQLRTLLREREIKAGISTRDSRKKEKQVRSIDLDIIAACDAVFAGSIGTVDRSSCRPLTLPVPSPTSFAGCSVRWPPLNVFESVMAAGIGGQCLGRVAAAQREAQRAWVGLVVGIV